MFWILIDNIIPTYFIQRHQSTEAPFGLSFSQQFDEEMIVFHFLTHNQPCMSRVQIGYFYGVMGTDYPAQVIPFAIFFNNRGRYGEVNTVHGAMVNTKGTSGICALLHVDSALRSVSHRFGINVNG